MNQIGQDRIQTGVSGLDLLLNGGIIAKTLMVIGGAPGTGKTTMAQQICFNNCSVENPAIYFNTLSEPTAKTLKYLQYFKFFDQEKLNNGSIRYVDLGGILRIQGLEQAICMIMENLKKIKPSIVVIDSFRVFSDLAKSPEEIRKFSYELAVQLTAWESTGFLIGEFSEEELAHSSLSSIVDGIVILNSENRNDKYRRVIRIVKMRGTYHNHDLHPFEISTNGIDIYPSDRMSIQQEPFSVSSDTPLLGRTGIHGLDFLLGGGIYAGSVLLLTGESGLGKTNICLEFIYKGAKFFKEKGVYFSFGIPSHKLIRTAACLGLDLKEEIEKGQVEIIYVPQAEIFIEKHLQLIQQKLSDPRVKRIVIDPLSTLFYNTRSDADMIKKLDQLTTLIQASHCIGFLVMSVSGGSDKLSRFGIEETFADGIIKFTSHLDRAGRKKYIEIYKLKDSNHSKSAHLIEFSNKGVIIAEEKGKVRLD